MVCGTFEEQIFEEEEEYAFSEALADAEEMKDDCEYIPARVFWCTVYNIIEKRFDREEIHYRIDEKCFWEAVTKYFLKDVEEFARDITYTDFMGYCEYYSEMI